MAIFRYIGVSTSQEIWAWLKHYLFMLVPFKAIVELDPSNIGWAVGRKYGDNDMML